MRRTIVSAAALVIVGLTNLLGRINAPALATQSIQAAFALGAEKAPDTSEVDLPPCHRHVSKP